MKAPTSLALCLLLGLSLPPGRAHAERSAKVTAALSAFTASGVLMLGGAGVLYWHSDQVLRDLHQTAPGAATLGDFNRQILLGRAQSDNEHTGALVLVSLSSILTPVGVTLLGMYLGSAL